MMKIWKERVRKLKVYRTGALYRSVMKNMRMHADTNFTELEYGFRYLEYGVYVERGTGRGVFRGNGGDIGRDNLRRRRPWMNPKYYMSVCNIRDFIAESVGLEFVEVFDRIFTGQPGRLPAAATAMPWRNITAVPGTNLPH